MPLLQRSRFAAVQRRVFSKSLIQPYHCCSNLALSIKYKALARPHRCHAAGSEQSARAWAVLLLPPSNQTAGSPRFPPGQLVCVHGYMHRKAEGDTQALTRASPQQRAAGQLGWCVPSTCFPLGAVVATKQLNCRQPALPIRPGQLVCVHVYMHSRQRGRHAGAHEGAMQQRAAVGEARGRNVLRWDAELAASGGTRRLRAHR